MGSSPSVAAATPGPAASICAEAGNTSEHTPYSLVRLCSAGGKFFSSSSTPASRAARCQDSMTDTATESTVNTWRKSNVVAPALMAARPCSSAAAALSTLSEVSDCRLSAWVDMAVFAGQLLYERSINLFGDGLQRLAGQRLVLGRQRLDQAVDAALGDFGREGALVGLHKPRAEHVDVIDLPTAGGLLDAVVELDGLAARHVHLRTHFDFGIAGVGAQRLEVDGFILDLRQRARVGEDQQRAELVLQRFLLVRRGGAPVATGRFGGHTLEVDVGRILVSTRSMTFFWSPAWIALSLLAVSITSWLIRLTSTSGASLPAGAAAWALTASATVARAINCLMNFILLYLVVGFFGSQAGVVRSRCARV